MADAIVENLFLVNAPAGSGKTTWIRKNVRKYLLQNPNDNVLCITYTNRAAEELGKDVDSNRVYFGTIHSFINDFIGSFFSHESILELYWEVYKNQIVERIENISQNGNWAESNMRYIEKYGGLTPEIVRSNITMISYNQAPFNSLYRGALGHDDLISFTRLAVERFPVIKKKISDKYQVVFIDEYQDTATDVLQIFYSSMIGKKSKLYLLGDKMQQIYRNYNGGFETYFNIFNKSINLSVNYRTTPKIVSILNKIYNDECYKQTAYEKNKDENIDFLPEVRIVTDIEKNVSELMEQYKDSLILYLSNKSRFYNIGVGELYDAYSGMEKYSFGKKYNAVDVLTKEEIRENDALLSFLFTVNIIVDYFTKEFYGEVFRIIRKAGTYFNCEKFIIRKHIDKHLVKDKLDDIVALYNELSTTVDDFLSLCAEKKYIREEFYSAVVEENDYQLVKNVNKDRYIIIINSIFYMFIDEYKDIEKLWKILLRISRGPGEDVAKDVLKELIENSDDELEIIRYNHLLQEIQMNEYFDMQAEEFEKSYEYE